MFTALGNYQNIYATSTFSGLSNGTLNSNLNGTLNILTPFDDEIHPGTAIPLINNDNPDEGDIDGDGNNDGGDQVDGNNDGGDQVDGNNDGGDQVDGNNDNPNENDVSGDSPFFLPFNSQFAGPSDDEEGDMSDKIPFP
jgi:hypothetical protein